MNRPSTIADTSVTAPGQAAAGGDEGSWKAVARNTLINWSGHLLLIVSGFVLPRIIDSRIGQERLGVWDFGWSATAYLTLINAGIASSVNRYVARHRTRGDWEAMNRVCSACAAVFLATALLATLVTVGLTVCAGSILPASFAGYVDEAQWLILFLGLASALNMYLTVYNGVLSGFQRYDLATSIECGLHITLMGVIAALLFAGYGLRAMAVGVLVTRCIEAVLKHAAAGRACPTLHIAPRFVSRAGIREVMTFGSKTFLNQAARVTLYQGHSLLIAAFLGPAAVAVHARAMALVMHANKLLFQFGRVLIPTASSLQAADDTKALAKLVVQGTRFSMLMALPMVLVLTLLGRPLMHVWMGEGYGDVPLLGILALGHLAPLSQTGAFYALQGMDRHGIPGLATLAATVLSIGASWIALWGMDAGLVSVSISIGVSLTVVNLFVIPVVIARCAGLSLRSYLAETVPGAVAAVLPFGLWLAISRYLLGLGDLATLLVGLGGGAVFLALAYWRAVVPMALKARVAARLRPAAERGVTS